MIHKLPPWVEVGGFLLAMIAGTVNAIGLLGYEHQAFSHLTGLWTSFGLQVGKWDGKAAAHIGLVVSSFFLGATLSGVIVRDTALQLGRRYGVALFIEANLLFLAMFALKSGSIAGHLLASAACGLQNALASTFSGAVVRTTHVTGLFTDLGIMLGSNLRGKRADARRIKLYLLLIAGFFFGAVIGGILFGRYSFFAMAFPASLALTLSLTYWFYWWVKARPAAPEAE